MLRHSVAIVACLLVPGMPAGLFAQVPSVPSPSAAAPAPRDPLGRDSPFSTVTHFSNAVHRNDFSVAGRYLQTDERSAQHIENLARDLSSLLDRYFTASLTSLSRVPPGDLTDGLHASLERVPLMIGNRPLDLFLTRVNDPDTGLVWVFSSDSLASVPMLHRSPAATWVERVMPASLVVRTLRGISLAQWILWAASIVLPLVLLWISAVVVAWVAKRRIADVTRRAVFLSWWNGVRWLLVVGLTLVAHLGVMPFLGFSLTFRHTYVRIGLIVTIVVAALLVWRLVSVTFHQAGLLAMRRGRSGTRSLIQFAERVVKVMVVLIAVFGLLALGGVDATTALAGVGIAGVAVALGAQKSVENLLGGIFLLTIGPWRLATSAGCPIAPGGSRTSRCDRYGCALWSRRCCRYLRACSHKAASRTSRRGARFSSRVCFGCDTAHPASSCRPYWMGRGSFWRRIRRQTKRAPASD